MNSEVNFFYENVYAPDNDRRMFFFVPRNNDKDSVPEGSERFLRPKNETQLIHDVINAILEQFKSEKISLANEFKIKATKRLIYR